jgi:hypothetical protein
MKKRPFAPLPLLRGDIDRSEATKGKLKLRYLRQIRRREVGVVMHIFICFNPWIELFLWENAGL